MAKVCKRRSRYVLDFYDQYGERQRITMPKGTTKKEAEEELDSYKDQVRRGIYVTDSKVRCFQRFPENGLIIRSQISGKPPGKFIRAIYVTISMN